MTKKDYEIVAQAIKQTDIVGGDKHTLGVLISALCTAFIVDDPKFDSNAFFKACKAK
jgi:hypothetical protein